MADEEESPLASAEVVRDLAANAHDLLIDILQASMDDEAPVHARQPLAVAAMRFCALAAAESGDTSLVEIIGNGLSMCAEWDDYTGETDTDVIRQALVSLLATGVRADERVRALAEDDKSDVRHAVAEGLRPAGPAEIALLRGLAKDTDASVRSAARKSLQGVADVPWWTGKLSQDPASRMSAREAKEADPILREIAALLDAPDHEQKAALAKAAERAKELPAAVAADLAEHALILSRYDTGEPTIAAFTQLVFAAPGAEAAFARVLTRWAAAGNEWWLSQSMGKAVAALPPARRTALCRKLVAGALGGDAAVVDLAAKVGAVAWPPGLDLSPVLDRIEAIAEEHAEDADDGWMRLVMSLGPAFAAANAQKGKTLARVVEAFLATGSLPFSAVEHSLAQHLEKLAPAALRPIAERAAASDRVATIRWGLEVLALKLAGAEPPLEATLRAFTADPRLRRGVAASRLLSARALPLLRAALRARTLDATSATQTVEAIHFVYGAGLIEWPYDPRLGDEERAKIDHLLGPAELRGPPTEDEWAALRAARDSAVGDAAADLRISLRVLPPGPWHEADRALTERALAAHRAGDDHGYLLACALASKPDAQALATFDELFPLLDEEDQGMTRDLRAKLVAVVGEPVKAAPAATPAAPAPAPAPREWMDEPEDEDDDDS